MAIITDIYKDGSYLVEINLNGRTVKHYEELGYEIPRIINKQGRSTFIKNSKILVRVEDLSEGSNTKVIKVCDFCGDKTNNQNYNMVIRTRKSNDGYDRCFKCFGKTIATTIKAKMKYEQSLKYNYPEIAERWNYKLNNGVRPEDIYSNAVEKYWWTCPDCNSVYEASGNNAARGCECPYCSGKKVNEKNCLWSVNPEIAILLWDLEEGYKYTNGSNEKVHWKCPHCENKVAKKIIANIVKRKVIPCLRCSDGVSYPEKFVYSLLTQLNVEFNIQKSFDWSNNKKYDFYIPAFNCIIESHGGQHYHNGFETIKGKRPRNEKYNDKVKEILAKNNNIINYIIIDCSISEMNYIKNNIIASELSDIFNLTNINWIQCHEESLRSLVKMVCDLWNRGTKNTDILAEKSKLSRGTIIRYLKTGSDLNWCKYTPKRAIVRLNLEGEYIDEYESGTDAAKQLNFIQSNISHVCIGKRKSAHGYKWMFKDEYEKLIFEFIEGDVDVIDVTNTKCNSFK